MEAIVCVECAGMVEMTHDVMLGEIAQCQDCGVELEVIGLDPVQIDLAPEIEEDWGE